MPARARLTRSAVALTVAMTAGTAALLTGCGPLTPTANGTTSPAAGPGAGSASPAPASVINGTATNGLTISDGTRYVVMNGTRIDFGTAVRDLAWSPDGSRAAFVDGSGDLVVSHPDGTGRTVVAHNPGGVNWSHPTWQVAPADTADGVPAKDNLIFTSGSGSTAVLETIGATAVGGTPKKLGLNGYGGEANSTPPQSGNVWPDAAGQHGSSVYANAANGEVYLRDDNLRQQGGVLAPGSEPALAPTDDGHVVFVRSVAGHDHLFLAAGGTKSAVKDLTPNATTDYTEPAWSPDGSTVAARTPDGIVTLKVDGAQPVKVSGYTGLPAYRG
ncbi:hypothetical protein POF50_019845 [Streptomyces sp. SL13]|uniref:WD40 repeat protein n=1 Tax=Streptantibioticus silvisoli TaxID=2705255 RepID=A0AA90H9T9_9ACTN|nr:hypothetical protein [Streptantibioticus silvisoli]MDI5965648.1 hypothetical protein [Streptantibioticus silvisoli]MDI5971555.1 hypothetical protein [Streptantibioticus silvisoli]